MNSVGLEDNTGQLATSEMQNVSAGKKKSIVYIVVAFILISVGALVFFMYSKYYSKEKPSKPEDVSANELDTPTVLKRNFEGKISYIGEEDNKGERMAIFELYARNEDVGIKKMNVWTDVKEEDNWQNYNPTVKIPINDIDEYVYVIFQDGNDSVSDIFFASIIE
jgi:hypothetical protein